MSDNEFRNAAADVALEVLQRLFPEAAAVCAPFLPRLFSALDDGHSFIWLNDAEAESLDSAAPLADGTGRAPLVLRGRRLFLGRLWQLENDLAGEIRRLAAAPAAPADMRAAAENLGLWFDGAGSEGQQAAAALALLQNFMLITGGPGTGKTTTVAKLLALLCSGADPLPRIALAAPTGKAAAHMGNALHAALGRFPLSDGLKERLSALEGQTVHRLLKLRPPQMRPQFDAARPLPLDILVVDEASMLDLALMLDLLRAVPDGCRVILLGDENQLPSVGAGAVLAALARPTVLDADTAGRLKTLLPDAAERFQTASNAPPLSANTARLTVSHRFGEHSGLGALARAVCAGDAAGAEDAFARFPEELSFADGGAERLAERFCRTQAAFWQAADAADPAAAFACQSRLTVLAARRGDAERFNEACRRILLREGRAREDRAWFAGQILMVERNDYAMGLFNGDIGIVMRDPHGSDGLSVRFPAGGGFRSVPLSRLPAHSSAFAVTVHKSQGSEYGEVWLLAPEGGGEGFNRSLLYTAVTRARERFVYAGSRESFAAACANAETRRTALREFLAAG
ncbi:exodeoxyribonuclease V subunit alpha [Neisseria sp. 23W00296]|uniref:exodeoxyribonuclease V subunit alpha n=1 Tax=unclassified Neisseria TaxID=2623750 RepID=UPI003757B0CE